MSLQVWLPLNGSIENQGLDNVTPTLMGTGITYAAGKIGSAAQFPNNCNSCIHMPGLNLQTGTFAAWIKVTGQGATSRQCIISEGRDSYSDGVEIFASQAGTTLYFKAHTKTLSTTITLNTWYHVCGTFGDNVVKMYLNGVQVATSDYTGEMTYEYSNNRLVLGKMSYGYTSTTSYFPYNGQLNDVRIYDHALSAKEVKELSKGLVLHYKLDKTNGGSANLLINTKNMTSITTGNNTCTWGSSGGIVDGESKISATTGWTNTSYGAKLKLSEMQGKTYTFSADVKAGTSGATYVPLLEIKNATINSASRKAKYRTFSMKLVSNNTSVAPITDYQRYYYTFTLTTDIFTSQDSGNTGVVDWANDYLGLNIHNHNNYDYYTKNWKLEEGSNPTPWCPNSVDSEYSELGYGTEYDCSGYGYDGTITGTLTSSSDSPRYNASTVFPSGGCVGLNNIPSIESMKQCTFSFWMKTSTPENTMCLWNGRTIVGGPVSVFVLGGSFRFDDGAQHTLNYSVPTNTMEHYVITRDTTNIKLYVNGILKATQSSTDFTTIGTKATIGASSKNTSTGSGNNFIGQLSDYRIYATALSADDVKELYQTAASIDNKGNVHAYELEEV